MSDAVTSLTDEVLRALSGPRSLSRAASVLAILVLGYLAVRICLAVLKLVGRRKLGGRALEIAEKAVKYGGAVVVLVNASEAAGIDLGALLGAAGIAGIAIGFAAQTSISNVISGLFLFSEKAFQVGDVIQLDALSGVVESVDMLSVKIRTFDNKLARVPNETMIKSNIVNVTRFPERRLDLSLVLPYGTDLEIVEALLKDAAMSVPAALSEPEPFFLAGELGSRGISVSFGVWFKKDDFAALKNALLPAILRKLEAAGIVPAPERLAVSLAGAEAAAPKAGPRRSSRSGGAARDRP
ncbi:MAG TPA: mechanosensitive ion channel [Spirochaetales bacterium]|nr:mechanosensitive ion channel [Spirochaetales bacterium]